VGHIGSQVEHKWLLLFLLNEADGLAEEDIGTVSLILLGHPVVVICIVEIIIPPVVGDLPDSSAKQSNHLFKALVLGPEWPGIAQVPFTELPCLVTILSEYLCDGHLFSPHHASPPAGAPGTSADGIPASH